MGKPSKTQRAQMELQKQENALALAQQNVSLIESNYHAELETNPEYSLVVDPLNKYKLPVTTKEFVRYYIEHRNINAAGMFCGIDSDHALELYRSYPVQQEVRRISKALYHRQFSKKMMSLSEIGGYLSSLIEDSDLPTADKLSTKDKLSVVKMLIDLNMMKAGALCDPSILLMRDVSTTIKDLSVGAIKAMLTQVTFETMPPTNVVADINDIRCKQNEPILTPEEGALLDSLSTEEALQILDEQYQYIESEPTHDNSIPNIKGEKV